MKYDWGLLETDANGNATFIGVDEILKRAADGRLELNHETKEGLARIRKHEPGAMINQRPPLGRPGIEVSQSATIFKRPAEPVSNTAGGPPKPLGRPGHNLAPPQQSQPTANQSQTATGRKPLGRPTF